MHTMPHTYLAADVTCAWVHAHRACACVRRSTDHPVDGFKLLGNKLTFDVDHGIELGHEVCRRQP